MPPWPRGWRRGREGPTPRCARRSSRLSGATTAVDGKGRKPVELAHARGHWKCVVILADVVELTYLGDVGLIEERLRRGADPFVVDRDGQGLMHAAAATNHVAVARAGAAKGVNPSLGDRSGWTPLHIAASLGHVGMVELLLSLGASTTAKDSLMGRTPLHCAAIGSWLQVTRLLLAAGSSATVSDSYCCEPLHLAAQAGSVPVCQELLWHGARLTSGRLDGKTPREVAAAAAMHECEAYLAGCEAHGVSPRPVTRGKMAPVRGGAGADLPVAQPPPVHPKERGPAPYLIRMQHYRGSVRLPKIQGGGAMGGGGGGMGARSLHDPSPRSGGSGGEGAGFHVPASPASRRFKELASPLGQCQFAAFEKAILASGVKISQLGYNYIFNHYCNNKHHRHDASRIIAASSAPRTPRTPATKWKEY